MTLTNPCGTCEAPASPGRYVCTRCTDRVRRLLASVPDLLAELDVTITKTHRFRPQGERVTGGGHDEGAVPFHIGASNARTTLSGVLRVWARYVAEALDAWQPADPRPLTASTAAAYLAHALDWAVSHPAGVDLVNQVERELTRAWQAVDRPVDRHYLGACQVDGCTGAVYQHGDRPDARCAVCRHPHDAAERRDDLTGRLRDQTLTAQQVERVTAHLGERVAAGKVRTWASRGRLVAVDGDQVPRYRLADVLALAGAA